jgi:tetratricopeptide (TPR) repeat protein
MMQQAGAHQGDEVSETLYPIQLVQVGPLHNVPAPLVRITTCGRVTLEVVQEVISTDPPQGRYCVVNPPERGKGSSTALNLLKLLVSLPSHAATRDWLSEHLPHNRLRKGKTELKEDEDIEGGMERVDNVVTLLRKMLCPPQIEGSNVLRPALVALLKNHKDSGPGYQLASAPLLWLDVDEMASLIQRACQREQDGQEALSVWEQVYALAARGPFLPLEVYSDWATEKRTEIDGYLKQAVLALHRLYMARDGQASEERMLLLLRTYCRSHPTDEDVLRPLLELLGKRDCGQEALTYYQRLCQELELEGRAPSQRTQHTMQNVCAEQNTSFHRRDETSAPFSPTDTQRIIETPEPEAPERLLELETVQETDLESGIVVDRREASKHLGILGLTLFTAPYRLFDTFPSSASPRQLKIDSETLRPFHMLTETCLRLSEGSQLMTAERVLWSYLPDVEAFAQQPSKQQRFAANIVSQNYLLAASLVGHRNDLQARQRFSEQAWLYGTLAQDCNLQVAALRQLAVTFDYLERPQKVLHTYQRALPYLNDVSPRLRACIYAALSGVYAQLKQKQEAARFIGLAYEHFPATTEDEPNFLRLINANYHTIILWDGLNQLELNQPQRAERIFTQLDVLAPTLQIPERIRVELLNYRAKVFSAVQNMEQACTYLEVAINASVELHSERRLRESFIIFQHVRERWPHEQRVQQLGDRFFHTLINHTQ